VKTGVVCDLDEATAEERGSLPEAKAPSHEGNRSQKRQTDHEHAAAEGEPGKDPPALIGELVCEQGVVGR
jgi:hypothetical protein